MSQNSLDYNEKDIVFSYLNNPKLPSVNSQFAWTPERIKELDKCRKNILHFAENYFYITTLDEGKKKIKLYKPQKRILKSLEKNRFVVLTASRQCGKALALNTPIPTPTGWITMGELKDGDLVFDNYGNPTKVKKAWDIMYNRPCYKITFDDGEEIIADEGHLWFTQNKFERKKKSKGSKKTTKDIFESLFTGSSNEPNHRIQRSLKGVCYSPKDLPIDPYVLGLWLGDGASYDSRITVVNRDVNSLIEILKKRPQFDEINILEHKKRNSVLNILTTQNRETKSLNSLLKNNNLIQNKHIPNEYLFSSREQRLDLLCGLMDSDGYIDKRGHGYFYNSNLNLTKQVLELIKSLGYKTTYKEKKIYCNGKECGLCGIVMFTPIEPVVKLPFKLNRIKIRPFDHESKNRVDWHYIKNIEPIDSVPVRCITVEAPDEMFLCGKSYIPTSNTTMMTIFAVWMACFRSDYRVILVANKEATAKNILKRVKMAFEYLPNWLKPTVKQWDVKEIVFGNDSSISITTTTSTAARGDTANCLIIDEMAFIPYNFMEDFWRSTVPVVTQSTKSKIFAISTPNGTGNKFYETYSKAERGDDPNWTAEKIDWWEIPGRDEKWKRSAIASLGSTEAFLQEYENMFISVGESAIASEVLLKYRKEANPPKLTLFENAYKIWEPPQKSHIYVIGGDVGEGIGSTASTLQILDLTDLTKIKQVACYRNQFINPYSFTKVLYEIAGQWGSPYIYMERNNVGVGVLDALYNTFKYPKIATFVPNNSEIDYERIGIYSHTNTKLAAITNMRYWVNDLQAVEINDITTVQEFETFVRYPNGTWKKKVGDSLYDDMVMALVWGLFALKPELCERYYEVLKYDDNGNPLKLSRSLYDGEDFFGNQTLSKNFNDSEPMPIAFGGGDDINNELILMQNNGWEIVGG